jgi:hypothetical protein
MTMIKNIYMHKTFQTDKHLQIINQQLKKTGEASSLHKDLI